MATKASKPPRKARRLLNRLKKRSDAGTVDIQYLIFGAPGTTQKCTVGLGSDGTVFVPAVMHPHGADGAFTQAGLDKIAIGQDKGFLFVPSDWLRNQLVGADNEKAKIGVIDTMVRAVRAHAAGQAAPA
ncbi:hypothetical protein [Ottowia sp.]|uniref:hypothetical protein n=1 Tax=Ottowia sp. TaxID=1898956 RepID=UPI0025F3A1DE|nr:hypothetical protein [Ottowia sp.]MBK6616071.1 hypothetical protein [Ottowia sp.]